MFVNCEGCYNCTETEDGYYCERYGTEIERVDYCEEWEVNKNEITKIQSS